MTINEAIDILAQWSITYTYIKQNEALEIIKKAINTGQINSGLLPWNTKELHGWNIVGMNHYHQDGRRLLFCSMIKGSRCITAEGLNERVVFENLAQQAGDMIEFDLENYQKQTRNNIPVCCQCHKNKVEKHGEWCETCRIDFSYGC